MKKLLLTDEEIGLLMGLLARVALNTPVTNPNEALENSQNITAFRFKITQMEEVPAVEDKNK